MRDQLLIVRFRCGTLPIRFETGPFRNKQFCDRLYSFCSEQCIEDEKLFSLHFL